MMCVQVVVNKVLITIPDFLPRKGLSIHSKGYVRYTGRNKWRGRYVHRAVAETLMGRRLASDEVVHHMDFNKLNNCPLNLLVTRVGLNPSPALLFRCPYTGRFMTRVEYERTYGEWTSTELVIKDDGEEF